MSQEDRSETVTEGNARKFEINKMFSYDQNEMKSLTIVRHK